MSSRRRTTYRNRLGLPAIMVVLVIVASLALVGLGIVISKNRVRALGEEQRQIEGEIRLLKEEIIRLGQSREKSFASQRLQPRLTKIATLLQPLARERIIVLPPSPNPTAAALSASADSTSEIPAAIPVARLANNTSPP
jgi:hypothetical protein